MRYSRAACRFILHLYQEAVEDYTKVLQFNPSYAQAYCERAHCYIYLKDFEAAMHDCNQAIMLSPKYAEAYFRRGNINYKLGNKVDACVDWIKASGLGNQAVNYNLRKFCK